MEELKKELDAIYKLVSGMYVCGEYVDTIATVREKLRHAFAKIEEMEVKGDE